MFNAKLSHNNGTLVPDSHLPPGICAHCHANFFGVNPIGVISEDALAAAQHSPTVAATRNRQFLQVSPGEIVVTGIVAATPDSATLHLEGTIGAVPHNFNLTFALDMSNEQLVVTLNQARPAACRGSWTFKLHPLLLADPATAAGSPVHYASASLVDASLPDLGGVIGCVIKCLGPQVIAIVLECLPSLIAGTQAFLACLVQQAQSSLPGVVQCIQQCQ